MKHPPYLKATLQALLVTFLWSVSMLLVKVGLRGIPPLTFAGLRYTLAFLCLLPLALRPPCRQSIRGLSAREWWQLLALGLLFYALTQGAATCSLRTLPPATVSLFLNFTAVIVAILGTLLLAERPTALQWAGILTSVGGVVVYFTPLSLPGDQAIGLLILAVGVLVNAASSLLGRHINREARIPALVVTIVSMGAGAAALLAAGLLLEPFPGLRPAHWLMIGCLAVVNTAFAFTLWNHALRTLSATASSILNNTMLIQVAILAWLFLGETLSWQEITGIVLVATGTLIVQLRRPQSQASTPA